MNMNEKRSFQMIEGRTGRTSRGLEVLLAVLFLCCMTASGAYAGMDCADCHISTPHGNGCEKTTCTSCHAGKLDYIKHPSGKATPLDIDLIIASGDSYPCMTCHVGPGTKHPFRISLDPDAVTGDTGLDFACGQCHGGAGPSKAGIPHMPLEQLSAYAAGMHGLAVKAPSVGSGTPVVSGFTVTFTDASVDNNIGSPSGLKVAVKWGDGNMTAGTGGAVFIHTYETAATYDILHTVSLENMFDSETITVKVPTESATGTSVAVTVKDYSGSGLSDVNIMLRQNGTAKKVASTDSSGSLIFRDVPSGAYELVAYKYGVKLDGNGVRNLTVDGDETVTFTQIQTLFSLKVNGPDGFVVTLKNNGVTKGIEKLNGGSAIFGNLQIGNYTVDGFYPGYACDQSLVTFDATSGNREIDLNCNPM